MALIRLGEIGFFKGGISTLDKKKYDSGIKFVNYMDIFNNYSIKRDVKIRLYNSNDKEYEKYNLKYGDAIFTASSETPEEIAISSIWLNEEKAIFNGFSKRYRYNTKILNPIYASYLFRSKSFRDEAVKYAKGYTRYNISQENLSNIKVFIPKMYKQQQIIDIIEQHEHLFKKYNKCIRIDEPINTKKDLQQIIDIIEPFEKLEKELINIVNLLIQFPKVILSTTDEFISLEEVSIIKKYSKLINSNYLSSDKKYLYSTGKLVNNNKKTNLKNFSNGLSIAYEGAGVLTKEDNFFLSIHLEDVYIARKYGIKTDYLFSIYYSIHDNVSGVITKSLGLKMPKLPLDILQKIRIPRPDQEKEELLESLFNLIEDFKNELYKLEQIKLNLITILIK